MEKIQCTVLAAALAGILSFEAVNLSAAERKIKITKRYLNFPISHKTDRRAMTLSVGGRQDCRFVIRLAEGEADYCTFRDVSRLKGKTVTLNYEGSEEALSRVMLADTITGQSAMYKERWRPQYHFTTRRGWINDPNGLVYENGRYHLYYQHNPYEREWENMHWGHAVSTDMFHWQEQPLALHPDTTGTMFSGSAVIDYDNTAGFNRKDTQAIVVFYTADRPEYQRQCMAYSTDGGMTFTKYEGNPIIESHAKWKSHDTRDPKVFWYKPGSHWVMVLNERDGHSIYTSQNLRQWTYQSHITGFWECPELFELPVDGGAGGRRWVMWGASGTYMTGEFDGKTFTPDGPKKQNMGGSGYAAQTFSNIPATDGRVIKMTWGRISFDGMPFNGCMLLPQEQILKKTADGTIRLLSRPIKETEQLFDKAYEASDLSSDEANKAMQRFDGNDVLRIKAKLHLTYATDAGLNYRGQRIVSYDMNGNRLNGDFYAPFKPGSMDLDIDVYVDRGMIEMFADDGAYSCSMKQDTGAKSKEGYTFWGREVEIKKLEVFTLKKPVWEQ